MRVDSSTPEDGGYRVVFEGCNHVVWFAVEPRRKAYCSACIAEILNAIRDGSLIEPVTPREFLVAHAPKLAQRRRTRSTCRPRRSCVSTG